LVVTRLQGSHIRSLRSSIVQNTYSIHLWSEPFHAWGAQPHWLQNLKFTKTSFSLKSLEAGALLGALVSAVITFTKKIMCENMALSSSITVDAALKLEKYGLHLIFF